MLKFLKRKGTNVDTNANKHTGSKLPMPGNKEYYNKLHELYSAEYANIKTKKELNEEKEKVDKQIETMLSKSRSERNVNFDKDIAILYNKLNYLNRVLKELEEEGLEEEGLEEEGLLEQLKKISYKNENENEKNYNKEYNEYINNLYIRNNRNTRGGKKITTKKSTKKSTKKTTKTVRCTAKTKAGTRCKSTISKGKKCHRH